MSPRKAERIDALTGALIERRSLHVRDAAALLGVSEMTVRRDVAGDPARFAFLGGHIVAAGDLEPEAPYELADAASHNAAAKRAACRHALAHVRAGDTLFIDCGTTLVPLIEMLPQHADITIVCYAMNVAERLARRPDLRMIMLGGLYHPSSASFYGSPGLETMDRLGINLAFITAAGIDSDRGATCANFHEVAIKQKAIALAQRAYLVTDTSKIGLRKPAFFAGPEAFAAIITENGETPVQRAVQDRG